MSNRDKPWFPEWDARRTLMMDESPEKAASDRCAQAALDRENATKEAREKVMEKELAEERKELEALMGHVLEREWKIARDRQLSETGTKTYLEGLQEALLSCVAVMENYVTGPEWEGAYRVGKTIQVLIETEEARGIV